MDREIEKKNWLKKHKLFVIGGTLIFCLLLYLIIFSDKNNKLNVDTNKVNIAEVKADIFKDYISVMGVVEPITTVYLDVTEGGRVDEILTEEGTLVEEGDFIIKLSNDNLLLEISNNEAQVTRAVNDLETLQINLENQQINNKIQLINLYYDLQKLKREYGHNITFYEKGLISKDEFLVSQANYEKNKANYELLLLKHRRDSMFMSTRLAASEKSVKSMQDNLNTIRGRLNKLIVKSPLKGELASLKVKIGEVISYGTRIGTINVLDKYKLRLDIDEHYLSRVKKELKGSCDFSNESYIITITKIYPEVKDGKFVIDMEFEKYIPAELRIGQTARINLELGESKQATLIPRGNFYQTTGGQWIYAVDKSGKYAIRRKIQIGRQNQQYYEVIEGLEDGERVIVSSYDDFGNSEKLILK